MRPVCLMVLCATFTAASAAAQQGVPVLRYTPPANAHKLASSLPEDY